MSQSINTFMEGSKGQLNYLKGDATKPIGDGKKVIVHICSNSRHWGKGFVLAISKKWHQPQQQFKSLKHFPLGEIQVVRVENDLEIINMIAQNGIKKYHDPPGLKYVDYDALRKCLTKVRMNVGNEKSVHMPRIGVGLGGGKWPQIEAIIKETLCNYGVKVFVYDL